MKSDRIGLATVMLVLATAIVGPAPANGQASGTASWTPAKTAWGHPDFQGVWVASEAAQPAPAPAPPPRPRPAATGSAPASARAGDTGAGPEHWYEAQPLIMTAQLRLVDPADGKIPALTVDGQQRATAASGRMRARPGSFLDFSPWDRCITRGVPGSMIPINYNNNYQFLQTRDTVVIIYEMIHDARIIPLNARPRIGTSIRQWLGDARGRWDGTSLVVETTNFTDKTRVIYGDGFHSDQLRLTERFTPVAADTMRYEFTVDDPATWTRPWTAVLTLKRGKAQDRLYEYACHEGNLAMHNMLSGARADEAAEDGGRP